MGGTNKGGNIMDKAKKAEKAIQKERDALIKSGRIKTNKDMVEFYKRKNKETKRSLWK